MKAILLYKTFSILAKTQKFMKAILLYKLFFILEKFVVFDGPSFLKSKVRTFFKNTCNFANRNVSKSTFQKYLQQGKPIYQSTSKVLKNTKLCKNREPLLQRSPKSRLRTPSSGAQDHECIAKG